MDVQELLSDSGIGREMHVIVGQGKLAEILESRPEDRRAFIEEAAGVLKHRKRKEKAVRKLDSMSANLARLTDLTTELRRQLKPLGRQAEMARRAQTIQADLRDARLRLAADDLVTRTAEFENTNQAETTLRREHDELATRLRGRDRSSWTAHEAAVDRAVASAPRPRSRPGSGCRRWPSGSARPSASPASGRSMLDAEPEMSTGRDPDELEAEAEQVAAQEQQLLDELAESRTRLEAARAELAEARTRRRRGRARAPGRRARRGRPPRRAGPAGRPGRHHAHPRRVDRRGRGPADRSASRRPRPGVEQTQAEFETVQSRVGELDAGEVGLDDHHDRTVAALRLADERVAELQAAERGAERQVASLRARIDALVGRPRPQGRRRVAAEEPQWRRTFRLGRQAAQGAAGLRGGRRGGARDGGRRAGRRELRRRALRGRRAQGVRRWAGRDRARRLARRTRRHPRRPLPDGALWAIDLVDASLTGCAARSRRCCPASRWCAIWPRRWTWWRRGRSCARSPPTATWSARAGSAAAPTASPARWRSPRRSTRRAPSWSRPERQAGELARRAVRRAGRAGGPPGRRRAGAGRAQRIRRRDLGDLRAARPARPGRPRRRRRMAAADRAARRAGSRAHPDGRGARRARDSGCATPQQEPTFEAEPVDRQDVDGRRRGARARRGGGPADRAHRRGTRECRSRTGGFAAPGRRRRARGAAARASGPGRRASTPRRWPPRSRSRDALSRSGSAPRWRWRRAPATRSPPSVSTAPAALTEGPRGGQRAERQDHRAHRRAAPRRGRQSPSGTAHRAARGAGARAVRDGRRRPGRRVRPRRARCRRRSWRWPSTSRPGSAASR